MQPEKNLIIFVWAIFMCAYPPVRNDKQTLRQGPEEKTSMSRENLITTRIVFEMDLKGRKKNERSLCNPLKTIVSIISEYCF